MSLHFDDWLKIIAGLGVGAVASPLIGAALGGTSTGAGGLLGFGLPAGADAIGGAAETAGAFSGTPFAQVGGLLGHMGGKKATGMLGRGLLMQSIQPQQGPPPGPAVAHQAPPAVNYSDIHGNEDERMRQLLALYGSMYGS